MGVQRNNKDKMSSERKEEIRRHRLCLGLLVVEAWEEGFSKLLQFKEAEGHCRVPQALIWMGLSLGGG